MTDILLLFCFLTIITSDGSNDKVVLMDRNNDWIIYDNDDNDDTDKNDSDDGINNTNTMISIIMIILLLVVLQRLMMTW